jgi:hypothetical protein
VDVLEGLGFLVMVWFDILVMVWFDIFGVF